MAIGKYRNSKVLNCLNIKSIIFFTNCGNRALSPLSCRWLMPKYCSTMYRNLEIALLRCISRSVSFALTWSFRIIPSLILLMARNLRFGRPSYPLSPNHFKLFWEYLHARHRQIIRPFQYSEKDLPKPSLN